MPGIVYWRRPTPPTARSVPPKAGALLNLDQLGAARDEAKRAIAIDNRYPWGGRPRACACCDGHWSWHLLPWMFRFELARVLYQSNSLEEAARVLKPARVSNECRVHNLLARIYSASGKGSEAGAEIKALENCKAAPEGP